MRFLTKQSKQSKGLKMAKQTKIVKINEARHMVITPLARASFPQLFTPRSFQDNPTLKKEYKVDLLFDPSDLEVEGKGNAGPTVSLKKAYFNAIRDQWGNDKAKWPKFKNRTFIKGETKTNKDGDIYEGYEGKILVIAKAIEKFKPRLYNADGTLLQEQDMYGGCYVKAKLIARPYDFGGNQGVTFKLYQLMKVKDGERFGGGVSSEMAFGVEEQDLEDSYDGDSDDDSNDF